MFFAIFGIPLALITIADLAKFVATIICYLYKNTKYLGKKIHQRFKRKHLALAGLGYTMAKMRSQMAAGRRNHSAYGIKRICVDVDRQNTYPPKFSAVKNSKISRTSNKIQEFQEK